MSESEVVTTDNLFGEELSFQFYEFASSSQLQSAWQLAEQHRLHRAYAAGGADGKVRVIFVDESMSPPMPRMVVANNNAGDDDADRLSEFIVPDLPQSCLESPSPVAVVAENYRAQA